MFIDMKFIRMVLPLVIPMALQNLINVAVSSADVIMLGRLSEDSLSAASLAGQVAYVLTLVFFGFSSGATVLTAQYWGERNIHAIEKVMSICIRRAFYVSFLFFIMAFFFPKYIMFIFTDNLTIVNEGIKYLRIISFSYILGSVSIVYLSIMSSVERVKISPIIYTISLVVNIIINYFLIFGKFGFPKMGIVGAAIGTLIARITEMLIVLYYNNKNKGFVQLKFKYFFNESKILKLDFYKFSIPVVLNELLWSSSMAAAAAIIGRLGTSFIAANSIANVIRQFATIISFGVATAAAIIIGKTIGEKKYSLADIYSKKFILFSIISGSFGSLLILFSIPLIVNIFALSSSVAAYLSFMLKVLIIYCIFQSLSVCIIVGIFRSGGDTRFALLVDACSAWTGSLILACIAAFYFHLNAKIIFLLIMSDEFIKMPFIIARYRSKKWLKNITRDTI